MISGHGLNILGAGSPVASIPLVTGRNRINTDPESFDYWMGQVDSGEATMFVSDGNPTTVTVPNQLAEDIEDMWDLEWAAAHGMEIIRYDLPQ